MRYNYTFGGLAGGAPVRLKTSADLVDGQIGLWAAGAAGSITDCTTTSFAAAWGVVLKEIATYTTTQGATEGEAEVQIDPLAVYRCRVVPSATEDTAYAAADGYLLAADSASAGGTTVADTDTGGTSNDMIDGLCFCLSGANKGLARVMTAHTASTSVVVTSPFPNAIAAGDTFVTSQYGPGVTAVQLTTLLRQADGTIAGGTGGDARVLDVIVTTDQKGFTPSAPLVEIDLILQDHVANKA